MRNNDVTQHESIPPPGYLGGRRWSQLTAGTHTTVVLSFYREPEEIILSGGSQWLSESSRFAQRCQWLLALRLSGAGSSTALE